MTRPRIKLFLVVLFHLALIILSIPFDSGDSIMGLISFIFGLPLIGFLVALIIIDAMQKNKQKLALLILNGLSLGFAIISIIWSLLAFEAIDFSSFAEVSIWYRLGPAFSFTFSVLVLIDTLIFVRFKRVSIEK